MVLPASHIHTLMQILLTSKLFSGTTEFVNELFVIYGSVMHLEEVMFPFLVFSSVV